jgi:glycosyltransferase involved in cell wall biosynthesis
MNTWKRIRSKLGKRYRRARTFLKRRLQPPFIFQDAFQFQSTGLIDCYSSSVREDLPNDYPQQHYRQLDCPSRIAISLIACVKNEAGSAEGWFDRVLNQTRLPDEIIIVDGGSTDATRSMLQSAAARSRIPIRVIEEPNGSIARNRNVAIQYARYPIIAVTDFGCFPRTDWLEKITYPFEVDEKVQVSAGIYDPIAARDRPSFPSKKIWEWANPAKIDPATYLPPGGSIAFRKTAWEAVGGYPEWLTFTGEDTYFDLSLKFDGGKWAFSPEAVVEWLAPTSLTGFCKKMYRWAVGDGHSGIKARAYGYIGFGFTAWVVFTLVLIALMVLSGTASPLIPIVFGILYGAVLIGFALRLGLPFHLLVYRVCGEIAQAAGFFCGAKRRKDLQQARSKDLKGVLFLLSGVPLDDTGGGSRGAQMTRELLGLGYAVIYIYQFPRYEARELGLRLAHPNLYCFAAENFDWPKFEAEYPFLTRHEKLAGILQFPHRNFLPIVEAIRQHNGRVLFDLIDDWRTSLGGDWFDPEAEQKLVDSSDVFSATVPALQEHLQKIGRRPVSLIPNAVNTRLFDPTVIHRRPEELPNNRRVIVYCGALWGDWLDWKLLEQTAAQNPRDLVCVIGDYRGQFRNPPENLKFLGLKAQYELPAYLAHSDVAIIPWKVTRVTLSTSPLKIYEYLAMHCPVVAPDLEPLRHLPGVFLARNEADFINLVRRVNRSQVDQNSIECFIEENDWSQRVHQILEILDGDLTSFIQEQRINDAK